MAAQWAHLTREKGDVVYVYIFKSVQALGALKTLELKTRES